LRIRGGNPGKRRKKKGGETDKYALPNKGSIFIKLKGAAGGGKKKKGSSFQGKRSTSFKKKKV